MNNDKNTIWAKFCSYFSNEPTRSKTNELAINAANSDGKELFNMIIKDKETFDNSAFMFDDETNEAWSVLQSKIHSYEKNKIRLFSFEHKPLLKIAASILFLIGISWISLSIYNQSKIELIQTKAFQSTEILPDGTTVYLNANSKIEYPMHFSSHSRKVKLSGEAYFDVAKDADRPFIISAKNTQIEVLGTSFNVMAHENSNKVEILVESGTVRVSQTNNSDRMILTKGQFGFSNYTSLSKDVVKDLNYLSWKTKLIHFNESPLTNVIDILNKTYASNIIIGNNVSSNFKLNAKFDKTSIDTILKSICLAFDLEQNNIDGKIQLNNKSD